MMSAPEFNKLLKLYYCDSNAAYKLNVYCLKTIKKRLLFRNGPKDLESLAHSVLLKFLSKLPEYVAFPKAYLNKCTDNYLSTLKRKMQRETALTCDISYEQRFDELEKFHILSWLEKYLDKVDAELIYAHCAEKIPEKQLAKEYNMTYSAVRQRISRGLKKLRKKLGPNVTYLDE